MYKAPEDNNETFSSIIYEDRDYGVFGILANVRNYHRFPTIDATEGLPPDISPSVMQFHARFPCSDNLIDSAGNLLLTLTIGSLFPNSYLGNCGTKRFRTGIGRVI
jgi:hypothetical protein